MTGLEIIKKNYEEATAKLGEAVDKGMSYSTYRKRLREVMELYWAMQRLDYEVKKVMEEQK